MSAPADVDHVAAVADVIVMGLAAIVTPVVPSWVRVASLPSPRASTAESDRSLRSFPIIASLATLSPPSVWRDPSVVDVASVVSSVLRMPDPVIVEAVRAAVAHVPPATVTVLEV